MREHWALIAIFALVACAPSREGSPPTGVLPDAGETRVFGTLHALMHEGKTGPEVALSSIAPGPPAYAVGALSELRGEVTVLDDVVWLAYPNDDGTARVTKVRTTGEQAALLVTANVAAWRRIPIAVAVAPDKLDDEIERLAQANDVDLTRPVPLLIEGDFADLDWHVIDGRKMATAKTHEEHAAAAVRGSVMRAKGTLVGFFSTRHQGVFTHMSKKTHFHVVLPAEGVSGHVDAVTLLQGATLLVPR